MPDSQAITLFEVSFRSGARTLVAVGRGALSRLSSLCAESALGGPRALLCDARLLEVQAPAIAALASFCGEPLARPVSEAGKSLDEVSGMCRALAQRGISRDGFVVAAGGGVLTDLAGLAAALHLRGVPWVSVPTTLLAQVDAGLGGKTGANLPEGKNLVGAFHQPRIVLCDTQLLSTLPVRELRSGLAEVVKCALLKPELDAGGQPFLRRCKAELAQAIQGDPQTLAPLVLAAVRVKAETVAGDEREGGARAYLNLGHTVGHALEAATGYTRFTHGEAVALGLRAAIALSLARGLLSDAEAMRALSALSPLFAGLDAQLAPAERVKALAALQRDKKARGGQVRFVLLHGLGNPQLTEVGAGECAWALDAATGATP